MLRAKRFKRRLKIFSRNVERDEGLQPTKESHFAKKPFPQRRSRRCVQNRKLYGRAQNAGFRHGPPCARHPRRKASETKDVGGGTLRTLARRLGRAMPRPSRRRFLFLGNAPA